MTSNTAKNPDNPSLSHHDSGRWWLALFTCSLGSYRTTLALMLSGFVCLAIALAGCSRQDQNESQRARSLVAPVLTKFPYEYFGKVDRSWGGDEYEIHHNGVIHWVKLIGVSGPEPAQHLHTEIWREMWKKWNGKYGEVVILSTDASKCEIGRVVVDGTDLSLHLLELGYGWYDGSDCEHCAEYQAAEEAARAKGIGIWEDRSPVDPKVFRKRDLDAQLNRLRNAIAE